MILDDLNRYYLMKVAEPGSDIEKHGWSTEKVSWEFRIDENGSLISVLPLGSDDGKRKFKLMSVPVHDTRTSAPKPFFLCDNAAYFIGLEACKNERQKEEYGDDFYFTDRKLELSREFHHARLDGLDDAGVQAVLRFFDNQSGVANLSHDALLALAQGGFITFYYLPDNTFIHERMKVVEAWQKYIDEAPCEETIQCAITGNESAPANLFPQLTGFPGAQSAGASLISFNDEAYCSYGRKSADKALNASISEDAAFNVGTALRYLMRSKSNHVSFGDSQIVFWTDAKEQEASDLLSLVFNLDATVGGAKEDQNMLDQIRQRLIDIRAGRKSPSFDSGANYYLLCLAPNAARLSVRFFQRGTMGNLERSFQQYLKDVEMIGRNGESDRPRSIRAYVYQTAALGKAENVPDTLVNASLSALVRNAPFPESLFTLLLQRTRVDKGIGGSGGKKYDAMNLRAAMLKACLIRYARQRGDKELERSLTVALNDDNRNVGYLLGRLFAVLEKAQIDAIPGANATIRDRFIGSASSTPARVFPQLLKMAQHHIPKAEYGAIADRRIEHIMSLINSEKGFPATLSYDDQGQFFIGYYQQKADFYASKNKQTESVESEGK